MSQEVNYKSIFSTVLPNVYIRDISLISSNDLDTVGSSLYDDDIEYEFVSNRYGKQVLEDRPINFVEASATGNRLMLRAELLVKDRKKMISRKQRRNGKRRGESAWVENDEVLEMLKMRVILCHKPQITELLRDGGLTDDNIKQAKRSGAIQERIISLKKRGKMSLLDFEKQRISRREMLYNVSYEIPFVLKKLNPRHLAIFAFTYVDLNEHGRKKRSPVFSRKKFLQGPAVGSTVIEDGKVPEVSYLYIMPNGVTWAGPVHYHEDKGYMAGAFHSRKPHPRLRRVKTANIKIKDYRVLEATRRAKLILEPKKMNPPGQRKERTQHKLKKTYSPSYISQPDYSVNKDNDLFLSFHVDYARIIKEKTQYGGFVEKLDPLAYQRLRELCKIQDIKVFRNRVVGGVEKEGYNLVDYEDRTELIAESTEGPTGILRPRRTTRPRTPDAADSEDIVIGSIREIDLGFSRPQGIRTFAVSDLGMSSRTDGKYNHTVEINVVDGTVKFIEEELVKLREAENFINEYYSILQNKKFVDQKTGKFTDAFRDMISESYNTLSIDMTEGATRQERLAAFRQSVAEMPWNIAVATYAQMLNQFTDIRKEHALQMAEIMFSLISPETGSLSGVELVAELIEKLENLISKAFSFERQLHMDERDYNQKTSAYKGKVVRDSFLIRKVFKKAHNSNVQSRVGYDFLDTSRVPRSRPGHRSVTFEKVQDRFAKEHTKYFSTPALNLNASVPADFGGDLDIEENYYAFLTPARAMLDKVVDVSPLQRGISVKDHSELDSFFITRIALNPTAERPLEEEEADSGTQDATPTFNMSPVLNYATPSATLTAGNSMTSPVTTGASTVALSSMGITTQPLAQFEMEEVSFLRATEGPSEQKEVSLYDIEDYLGVNTKQALELVAKLEENPLAEESTTADVIGKATAAIISPVISSTSGLFAPVEESRPSLTAVLENPIFLTPKFVSGLPNQIKSLYPTQQVSTVTNWVDIKNTTGEDLMTSPKYASTFYMNYSHINKVLVLTGFKKDKKGDPILTSPVFKKLTRARLRKAENLGNRLFCKMESYSNSKLKIKKNIKLGLPEFDSCFFIEPMRNQVTNSDNNLEEAIEVANELSEQISQVVEDDETVILATRIAETVELYGVGRDVMAKEASRMITGKKVSAEYQSNMFVSQAESVSKIGTNYDESALEQSSSSRSARVQLTRQASGRQAMPSAPDTAGRSVGAPTTTSRGGGSSGGGY